MSEKREGRDRVRGNIEERGREKRWRDGDSRGQEWERERAE